MSFWPQSVYVFARVCFRELISGTRRPNLTKVFVRMTVTQSFLGGIVIRCVGLLPVVRMTSRFFIIGIQRHFVPLQRCRCSVVNGLPSASAPAAWFWLRGVIVRTASTKTRRRDCHLCWLSVVPYGICEFFVAVRLLMLAASCYTMFILLYFISVQGVPAGSGVCDARLPLLVALADERKQGVDEPTALTLSTAVCQSDVVDTDCHHHHRHHQQQQQQQCNDVSSFHRVAAVPDLTLQCHPSQSQTPPSTPLAVRQHSDDDDCRRRRRSTGPDRRGITE